MAAAAQEPAAAVTTRPFRVFLLSPADCSGTRARRLQDQGADHDLAPGLLAKFRSRTIDATDVLAFTRNKTPYLEKHARGALKLLESGGVKGARIAVAEKKASGDRRKAGTFPEGTVIRFPS